MVGITQSQGEQHFSFAGNRKERTKVVLYEGRALLIPHLLPSLAVAPKHNITTRGTIKADPSQSQSQGFNELEAHFASSRNTIGRHHPFQVILSCI